MCPVFIQKLYFNYDSSVHKACKGSCTLDSGIRATLLTDEHALIGHDYGQLLLIDPDTAHTRRLMNGHTGEITCIVYCPELSMVITGSNDKTARVWDVATGECVHVLGGHTAMVYWAAVHGTTYVHWTLLIDTVWAR